MRGSCSCTEYHPRCGGKIIIIQWEKIDYICSFNSLFASTNTNRSATWPDWPLTIIKWRGSQQFCSENKHISFFFNETPLRSSCGGDRSSWRRQSHQKLWTSSTFWLLDAAAANHICSIWHQRRNSELHDSASRNGSWYVNYVSPPASQPCQVWCGTGGPRLEHLVGRVIHTIRWPTVVML